MKHITGLAHVALYTEDLNSTIRFYEMLGGKTEGREDVKKPAGTNHLAMIRFSGFYLEIIEPHDGTVIAGPNGLFPHIAIETDNIDETVRELKSFGISTFASEEPMDMPIFGGIRNIFFTGPQGEKIELLQHKNA